MNSRAIWVVRGVVAGTIVVCLGLMGCTQQKQAPPEEPPKAEIKPTPPPPPPVVTPRPAAAPAPSYGGEYVVQKGDTLFSIARRFSVKMADLQAINNIANPNLIKIGQKLRIPAGGGAAPAGGGGGLNQAEPF